MAAEKSRKHDSRQEPSSRPLNYQREVSVHLTPTPLSSYTSEERKKERQNNALHVPKAVLRPGCLPDDLQEKFQMHQMKAGERIFWRQGGKDHFSSVWLDENLTRPCHNELRRLQECVLKSQTSRNLKKGGVTGDIIHLSISTRRAISTIQPHKSFNSNRNNKNDPLVQETIMLMGAVFSKLFRIGLPADMVELYERRSAMDVSLGTGHEDNVFTSHSQANLSLIGEDLPTAIGAGGALHIDANNDPARISIMIFLSHLPKGYCPGKIILPSESVYCITAPYTAVICSGHLPHWPIPPAKYEDTSIRYSPAGPTPPSPKNLEFRRLTVVSYPEKMAMNRAPDFIKDILLQPESLFVYGTKRNQHEFWARLQAKRTLEIALETDAHIDDDDVSRIIIDNCWDEDGETKWPRSRQIKEILFGDPDDHQWKERVDFIADHISCGFNFRGGRRKAEPILTDDNDANWNKKDTKPIKEINHSAEPSSSTTESDIGDYYLSEGPDLRSSGNAPLSRDRQQANILVKYLAALQAREGKTKRKNKSSVERIADTNIKPQGKLIVKKEKTADLELRYTESGTTSECEDSSGSDSATESDSPIIEALTHNPVKFSVDIPFTTKPSTVVDSGMKRKRSISDKDLKPREPLVNTPMRNSKYPRLNLPGANKSSALISVSKRERAEKDHENELKNLVDLVVKDKITAAEYNSQVEKLARQKARWSVSAGMSSY